MKYFKLPDLGEGLPEAEIVEWHVTVGDAVKTDQIIVSVETAKAIVEVPSPVDGVIASLFGQAGDLIHTGEPLVEFEGGESQDSGTVVGEMKTAGDVVEEDNFIIGSPNRTASTASQNISPTTPQVSQGHSSVLATPAIRALAKRLQVDLSLIKATGPNGMITADDVEKACQLQEEHGASEPLKGVRRAMAINMAKAHAEVPQVFINDDANIRKWKEGTDPTIRLVRAIGVACQAVPALNTWYDGASMSRRLMSQVDIGIAVDTPDGLFVPVLRNVTERKPEDLREGLDQLRSDVKSRKIPPKELMGATITLSNFGTIAGRYANPIVVPPTVAIIGAGRTREEVIPHKGELAIHPIMPISLSVDHRAVTGGEAARFLKALIEDLEQKK